MSGAKQKPLTPKGKGNAMAKTHKQAEQSARAAEADTEAQVQDVLSATFAERLTALRKEQAERAEQAEKSLAKEFFETAKHNLSQRIEASKDALLKSLWVEFAQTLAVVSPQQRHRATATDGTTKRTRVGSEAITALATAVVECVKSKPEGVTSANLAEMLNGKGLSLDGRNPRMLAEKIGVTLKSQGRGPGATYAFHGKA
jgi:hypothetical protein